MVTRTSRTRSTPRSPHNDAPILARPRRASLAAITLALALAGAGVAAYLTTVHYDDSLLVCTIGDCATVQKSKYSEVGGIPVAIFGLGMYLTIIALGLVRWRRPDLRSTATMGIFALALTGTVFSAYLTYLELWVIDAVCQWCVVSALLTLGILILEGIAAWRILGEDGGAAV